MGVFSFLKTKAASGKEIVVDNQVYQSLLGYLTPGTVLQRDSAMSKYMEYGYGNNADVFAITNKIISLFAQMPIKVTQNGKDIPNPITPNNRTFFEFKAAWEMFAVLSGNAITYVPTLENGNNAGLPQLFEIMPTHHVEIESAGWGKPIGQYKFDLNQTYKFDPKDVWHTRVFPNWDYTNGANFMGMSPIKVAVNIINAQNNGYNILSKSFERGMPPGILTRKDMSDLKMIRAHEEELTRAWLKKHGKSERAGLPVFAIGDYDWIQLGFSTLRDMDIIASSEHGLRTLCNLWGLPSTLFNDQASSTYNNLKTATKTIYTNRVIPDMTMFCEGLTTLYTAKGIKFEPDISQIPEMQEDKMELAKVYDIGVKNRSISRNEFRAALGMEPVEAFGMELEEMLGEDQQPDPEEALRQLQQRNAGNDYDRG